MYSRSSASIRSVCASNADSLAPRMASCRVSCRCVTSRTTSSSLRSRGSTPCGRSASVMGAECPVDGGRMHPRHTLRRMARYFDVHPVDPQRRAIGQVVDLVRDGGLIAYPTDSCYALGCQIGDRDGIDRIRTIRKLDERHHFTLVCRDFAQLGQFVHVSNAVFRAVKAATPGSYTFILPATREVPRRLLHPRKKTVGVRIPEHAVTSAILAE